MSRTLIVHGILKSTGHSIQILIHKDLPKSIEHHHISHDIHTARSSGHPWIYAVKDMVHFTDVSSFAQINVLITEDKV
jgi:hypothetical protein